MVFRKNTKKKRIKKNVKVYLKKQFKINQKNK